LWGVDSFEVIVEYSRALDPDDDPQLKNSIFVAVLEVLSAVLQAMDKTVVIKFAI